MKSDVDMLKYEKELLAQGYRYIAGVDEVGRGPLAGDLVVAAVIMDLDNPVDGVDDSKKLTEKKRESLYPLILSRCISYNVVHISPQVVDAVNIYNATKLAMEQAVEGLFVMPDFVLVDAMKPNLSVPYQSLIKGDALSYSIACASIIAKVTRDREMVTLDTKYPEYDFAKNKGYGTATHIEALKVNGPCEIHRRTFIKNFLTDD